MSRHQQGTYSYFIDKKEEQFDAVEYLEEDFLEKQLMFLNKIEKNSVEEIVGKMQLIQKISSEKIIKFHKRIVVGKKNLHWKKSEAHLD